MALNEYTNPYEDHDYFLNVQATEQKALAINTAIRHEYRYEKTFNRGFTMRARGFETKKF